MKTVVSSLVTVLVSSFSLSAFAGCDNPTMVEVPDGSTVSMEMLLEAQAGIKTYMAEMEVYLACLNEDIDAAGEDAADEFKSLMVTRHNSAVSEMETIAALFNEQVQAYRAANPE